MPENKGHCKHGEFDLVEGCPQCIAEFMAVMEGIKPSPDAELIHSIPCDKEGVNNA